LLVKSSYRRRWTLPGGGIRGNETALAALLREMREELGLDIDPARLHKAMTFTDHIEHRRDEAHLFELELDHAPALHIDHREIVAARFFEVGREPLPDVVPNVRLYLSRRHKQRVEE